MTVGQSSDPQQALLKGPPGSTPVLLERLAAKAGFPTIRKMYDLCRSRVEKGEVPEQVASSRILEVLGPPGAAKTTCLRSFTHTVLDGHPKAVKTVLFAFHSRSARDEQTLKLEGIGLKEGTHFVARTFESVLLAITNPNGKRYPYIFVDEALLIGMHFVWLYALFSPHSVICLLSGDEQIRQLECHSPWQGKLQQKDGAAFAHGEHWAQAISRITLRRTYRLGPKLWRVAESMLRAAHIPSSVEAFGPAEGEFRVRCRDCSTTAIRWLLADVADGQHDLVVCGTAAELRDILNQTRAYGGHAFRIPEKEIVEKDGKLERFVAHLSRGNTSHRCVFTTSHRAQGSDEKYVAFAYVPRRTDAWPPTQRVQGCEFLTHLFVSLTRASLLCALYTTTGELYEHLCALVPELKNIPPDEHTRATVGSARVQTTVEPSPRLPLVLPPISAATLAAGEEEVASTELDDDAGTRVAPARCLELDAVTLDEDAVDRAHELPRDDSGVDRADPAHTSFPSANNLPPVSNAIAPAETDGAYNPFGLCGSIWVSCVHGFVHLPLQEGRPGSPCERVLLDDKLVAPAVVLQELQHHGIQGKCCQRADCVKHSLAWSWQFRTECQASHASAGGADETEATNETTLSATVRSWTSQLNVVLLGREFLLVVVPRSVPTPPLEEAEGGVHTMGRISTRLKPRVDYREAPATDVDSYTWGHTLFHQRFPGVHVVTRDGEPFLAVAKDLGLADLGKSELGVYSLSGLEDDALIASCHGRIVQQASTLEELNRFVCSGQFAEDGYVLTRYAFVRRAREGWQLLDSSAADTTCAPMHLINDARGTSYQNNVAVDSSANARALGSIPPLPPGVLPGAVGSERCILYRSYSDGYWTVWGENATVASPSGPSPSPPPPEPASADTPEASVDVLPCAKRVQAECVWRGRHEPWKRCIATLRTQLRSANPLGVEEGPERLEPALSHLVARGLGSVDPGDAEIGEEQRERRLDWLATFALLADSLSVPRVNCFLFDSAYTAFDASLLAELGFSLLEASDAPAPGSGVTLYYLPDVPAEAFDSLLAATRPRWHATAFLSTGLAEACLDLRVAWRALGREPSLSTAYEARTVACERLVLAAEDAHPRALTLVTFPQSTSLPRLPSLAPAQSAGSHPAVRPPGALPEDAFPPSVPGSEEGSAQTPTSSAVPTAATGAACSARSAARDRWIGDQWRMQQGTLQAQAKWCAAAACRLHNTLKAQAYQQWPDGASPQPAGAPSSFSCSPARALANCPAPDAPGDRPVTTLPSSASIDPDTGVPTIPTPAGPSTSLDAAATARLVDAYSYIKQEKRSGIPCEEISRRTKLPALQRLQAERQVTEQRVPILTALDTCTSIMDVLPRRPAAELISTLRATECPYRETSQSLSRCRDLSGCPGDAIIEAQRVLQGVQNICVDLCSGVGGASLGELLSHAPGFSKLFNLEGEGSVPPKFYLVDSNAKALEVAAANLPASTTCCKFEITEATPLPPELELLASRGIRPVLLMAGSPCQPFSQLGLQKGADDPRDATSAVLAGIRRLDPLQVVIENVKNLEAFQQHLEGLCCELQRLGYWVHREIVQCEYYGVPQRRTRLLLFASKLGFLSLPGPLPVSTLEQALRAPHRNSDPSLEVPPERLKQMHRFDGLSGITRDRSSLGEDTSRTVTRKNSFSSNDALRFEQWRRPAGLQLGGAGLLEGLSDFVRRFYTFSELQVIQGFPPHFKMPVSSRQRYEGIGNALPPVVAAFAGHTCARAIRRSLALVEAAALRDKHRSEMQKAWRLKQAQSIIRRCQACRVLRQAWRVLMAKARAVAVIRRHTLSMFQRVEVTFRVTTKSWSNLGCSERGNAVLAGVERCDDSSQLRARSPATPQVDRALSESPEPLDDSLQQLLSHSRHVFIGLASVCPSVSNPHRRWNMYRPTHTDYADAALSLLHDTNQAVRDYLGRFPPSDATEYVCTMLLDILRHGACRPFDQVYSEWHLLHLNASCPMSSPVERREYEQLNPFGLPRPSRGAVKKALQRAFALYQPSRHSPPASSRWRALLGATVRVHGRSSGGFAKPSPGDGSLRAVDIAHELFLREARQLSHLGDGAAVQRCLRRLAHEENRACDPQADPKNRRGDSPQRQLGLQGQIVGFDAAGATFRVRVSPDKILSVPPSDVFITAFDRMPATVEVLTRGLLEWLDAVLEQRGVQLAPEDARDFAISPELRLLCERFAARFVLPSFGRSARSRLGLGRAQRREARERADRRPLDDPIRLARETILAMPSTPACLRAQNVSPRNAAFVVDSWLHRQLHARNIASAWPRGELDCAQVGSELTSCVLDAMTQLSQRRASLGIARPAREPLPGDMPVEPGLSVDTARLEPAEAELPRNPSVQRYVTPEPGTESLPSTLSKICYEVNDSKLVSLGGVLIDSGGSVSVLDKGTVDMLVRAGAANYVAEPCGSLHGVGADPRHLVGKAAVEFLLLDSHTNSWRRFQHLFLVASGEAQLRIVGNDFRYPRHGAVGTTEFCCDHLGDRISTPVVSERRHNSWAIQDVPSRDAFLAQWRHLCNLAASTVASSAATVEGAPEPRAGPAMGTDADVETGPAPSALPSPSSSPVVEREPLVYLQQDVVCRPHGDTLFEAAVSPHLYGSDIIVFPLRDEGSVHWFSHTPLEIHPHVSTVREGGKIVVAVRNSTSAPVSVPVGEVVAHYCMLPASSMPLGSAEVPSRPYNITTTVVPEFTAEQVADAMYTPEPGLDPGEQARRRQQLLDLLTPSRRALFSNTRLGQYHGERFDLELKEEYQPGSGTKRLQNQPPRRLSDEKAATAIATEQAMIANGVLTPSHEDHGVALVVVPKPSGGYRVAQDFREVNAATVPQYYPLPLLQTCLDKLKGKRYFTTLDMISAFWQIGATERASRLMSINFPGGRYRMNVMCMGLQGASSFFQRCMDKVLRGLDDFVVNYLDDILIGSDTWEEHVQHVGEVLDRLAHAGFTLRPKKCHVGVRKVDFLGYVVDAEGYRPSESNASAITSMDFPDTEKDMRTYLGMVNFFSDCIPGCQLILAPLQARVNFHSRGAPTEAELAAFHRIRAILSEEGGPVLMPPDTSRPFHVATDASDHIGLGAVLFQTDDQGRQRPVRYFSHRWKDNEQHWKTVDKEAYAVVTSIKRWDQFLSTGRFKLYTDAEAVSFMMSKKESKSPRMHNWALELQNYNFDLLHLPGSANTVPDALSRLAHLVASAQEVVGLPCSRPADGDEGSVGAPAVPLPATHTIAAAIRVSSCPCAAVVTDGRCVLVARHEATSKYHFGARLRKGMGEPIKTAASRGLVADLLDASDQRARRLLHGCKQVLNFEGVRYLLVPASQLVVGTGNVQLRKHAVWLDILDDSITDRSFEHQTDRLLFQCLREVCEQWDIGHHSVRYPAVSRAFTDFGVQFLQSTPTQLGRTGFAVAAHSSAAIPNSFAATPVAGHDTVEVSSHIPEADSASAGSHEDASKACDAVDITADFEAWRRDEARLRRSTAALQVRTERYPANEVLTNGVHPPSELVCEREGVVRILERLDAWYRRCEEIPELEPQSTLERAAGLRAVLAVDLEFTIWPNRPTSPAEIVQIGFGGELHVISVVRNDWILRDPTVTTAAGCVIPGLRFYLENDAVVKVMHWCSNDAVILSHYGIVLASVWDTAHGDSIPDGRHYGKARGLAVVTERWAQASVAADEDRMPHKGNFKMTPGMFRRRPLGRVLFDYCWQDVAYLHEVYFAQREASLALSAHHLDLAYACSFERSRANNPSAKSTMYVADTQHVLFRTRGGVDSGPAKHEWVAESEDKAELWRAANYLVHRHTPPGSDLSIAKATGGCAPSVALASRLVSLLPVRSWNLLTTEASLESWQAALEAELSTVDRRGLLLTLAHLTLRASTQKDRWQHDFLQHVQGNDPSPGDTSARGEIQIADSHRASAERDLLSIPMPTATTIAHARTQLLMAVDPEQYPSEESTRVEEDCLVEQAWRSGRFRPVALATTHTQGLALGAASSTVDVGHAALQSTCDVIGEDDDEVTSVYVACKHRRFVLVAGSPDPSIKRSCANKACHASCCQWYADIERHAPGALNLEALNQLAPVAGALAPSAPGAAAPDEDVDPSPAPGAAPLRCALTSRSIAFTFAAATSEPSQASKLPARPDAEAPSTGSDEPLEEAQVTQVCVLVHDGQQMVVLRCDPAEAPASWTLPESGLLLPAMLTDRHHPLRMHAESVVDQRLGPLRQAFQFTRKDLRCCGAQRSGKVVTAVFELRLQHPLDGVGGTLLRDAFARRTCPPSFARRFPSYELLPIVSDSSLSPLLPREAEAACAATGGASQCHLVPILLHELELISSFSATRYGSDYSTCTPEMDSEVLQKHRAWRQRHPLERNVPTIDLEGVAGELMGLHPTTPRTAAAATAPALAQESDITDVSPDRATVDRVRMQRSGDTDAEGVGATVAGGYDAVYAKDPHRLRPAIPEIAEFLERMSAKAPVTAVELREAQAVDQMCALRVAHQHAIAADGTAEQREEWARLRRSADQKSIATVLAQAGQYLVLDGILHRDEPDPLYGLWHPRAVVPCASLRERILTAAHDGHLHLGREKTLSLVEQRYWWPGLSRDVARKCQNCETCAFNDRARRTGEAHIPPYGHQPWSCITADIVYLEPTASGYDSVLVVVDRYTRRVRLYPTDKSMTSNDFINILMFGLFKEIGFPHTIITDSASVLISATMQRFYKAFGIMHLAADPHMHTAVATSERFNATLRSMARAAYFDSKLQWDVWLPFIELMYNATAQRSTGGYSPFFLDCGRQPRLPWDLFHEHRAPAEVEPLDDKTFEHRVGKLHNAWRRSELYLTEKSLRDKARKDPPLATVRFKPGDHVLLKRPADQKHSKMDFPYYNTVYAVKSVLERDRYQLETVHGRPITHAKDTVHVSRLKRMPSYALRAVEDSGLYYEVEKICGHRGDGRERRYRVRWSGFPPSCDTWEPVSSFNEAGLDHVDEYCGKHDLRTPTGDPSPPPTADAAAPGSAPATAAPPPPAAQPEAALAQQHQDRDARRERRAADSDIRYARAMATDGTEDSE